MKIYKASSLESQIAADAVLPSPSIQIEGCKFVYNFYKKDETVNESSGYSAQLELRRIPRYVELSIKQPQNVQKSNESQLSIVKQNINKIYSVEDVGNSSYTSIISQDSSFQDRMYQTILRSSLIRGIEGNMTDIPSKLSISHSLNQNESNLIQALSVSYAENGAQFIDRTRIQQGEFNKIDRIKDFSSFITVSDKFLNDFLLYSEKNTFIGNSISLTMNNSVSLKKQNDARGRSNTISPEEFVTILEPISYKESNSVANTKLGIEHIATLLYRQQQLDDGSRETKLLDVISPTAINYVDKTIKIDAQYSYWLNCVYKFNVHAKEQDSEQVLESSILFQSRPSEVYSVFTRDTQPPDPPSDFDARWDYENRRLILTWSFPVNPKLDIKYFQIFRRSKIDDPFEMLAEYDFNDSMKIPLRFEDVNQDLVKKMQTPLGIYIDNDFKKDSKYIYTVACVDARGLVSNYSHQTEVSFNKTRNVLVKKSISPSGAPRQYPNVFLKESFFKDVVLTSKKRKIKIFFDPEYLKILTSKGDVIDGVITSKDGNYTLNVLDINRAQAKSTVIRIVNLLEGNK